MTPPTIRSDSVSSGSGDEFDLSAEVGPPLKKAALPKPEEQQFEEEKKLMSSEEVPIVAPRRPKQKIANLKATLDNLDIKQLLSKQDS